MKIEDVLNTLGLEDVKDLDAFKEKFQGKFITKDEALNDDEIKGKITGKVAGAATTLIKRHFDLDNSEIKDKKWEDILELGVSKLKASIKDLEGKQGQSNDEALKETNSKLEKALKTISDFKEQNEALKTGLETTEKTWSEKYTGLRKSHLIEGAKSKLSSKLRDLSDLEKEGFDLKLKNNILIEFDEKDEVVVKGPDGKRIANPNKIGSFLNLDEALELVATQSNVIKKNNGGGQPNPGMFNPSPAPANPTPQPGQRQIHPSALKQVEVLKANAAGNL